MADPTNTRLRKGPLLLLSALVLLALAWDALRARTALEKHQPLPPDLPQSLAQVGRPRTGERASLPLDSSLPTGAKHEVSSREETGKFELMGKITDNELSAVDLDELSRRLQGE